MKFLFQAILTLLILISCKDKEVSVDASISIDQSSYSTDDTINIDFEVDANVVLEFVEAKVLDENSIAASITVNQNLQAKQASGQLRLTFLDQFHEAGTYTVQVSFGHEGETYKEFEDFTLNTGNEVNFGFLVSEVSLGNSNVYLINDDGKQLLSTENSAIDLLAVNNTYDQYMYAISNNETLKISSVTNGLINNYTFNSFSDNYLRDGTSDNSGNYFCTDDGKVVKTSIDGSTVVDNTIDSDKELTSIAEFDDFLAVASTNVTGNMNDLKIIAKSTLNAVDEFSTPPPILDVKSYDNRVFFLTLTTVYELRKNPFSTFQYMYGTNMESFGGFDGTNLYINKEGLYHRLNVDEFRHDDITHEAEEILVISENNWIVYNYGTKVEIRDLSSGVILNTYEFDGTITEIMAIN